MLCLGLHPHTLACIFLLPLYRCFQRRPSFSLSIHGSILFLLPPKWVMVLILEIWLYLYHSRDLVLPNVITNNLPVSFILCPFSYPTFTYEFSLSLFPLPSSQLILYSWMISSTAQYQWLQIFISIRASLLCWTRTSSCLFDIFWVFFPSLLFLFPKNLANGKTLFLPYIQNTSDPRYVDFSHTSYFFIVWVS